MGIVTVNDDRCELRVRLQRERLALSVEKRHLRDVDLMCQLSAYVSQNLKPNTMIAMYQPIKAEPNLLALVKTWQKQGFHILLPIVIAKNEPLQFALYEPDDKLKKGAYGILEPELPKDILKPDLVVLPCVGFNSDGYRIGYGGGYYDRTLAKWLESGHEFLAIGVAYKEALCHFDAATHDVVLDAILTA